MPVESFNNPLTGNTVAVYWDFENLHAALYERDWGGSRSYGEQRYTQQDVFINIRAVMDFAAGFGDVAINRAYNNWQWFSRYRDALSLAGIDLIQIYPKGARAKNGADIRLALDAMEDMLRYPKLTHVIIVSSDSDFISLAQKLKQSGLTVIGIGVQQATNLFWAQNCDEFRDYNTLPGMMVSARRAQPAGTHDEGDEDEPAVRPMSLEEARELTVNALRHLIAQKGVEQVPKSSLKFMMKRMDSTFDESNLGFLSFSAFIKTFADAIEEIEDNAGGQVRLRSATEQAEAASAPAPAAAPPSGQNYEMILHRGNVRLLPTPWWREAVRIVGEIFKEAPQNLLTSFDDLEGELSARLEAEELDGDPVLVHRLRGLLFALFQFQLNKENQTIRLKASDGESLLRSVDREMVRRIVRFAAPPVDVAKVAAVLYGDDAQNRLADAQELVNSFPQK
jgi:uncharacterized LabA/DUF88 family protein